jgi:hypothetical protein
MAPEVFGMKLAMFYADTWLIPGNPNLIYYLVEIRQEEIEFWACR